MPDPKLYASALEKSLQSLEAHTAEMAGSVEKLRASTHNVVARLLVLDEISAQLENVAKTQRDLVMAVGIMNDTIREIHGHWMKDSSEVRKRLGQLEKGAAQ